MTMAPACPAPCAIKCCSEECELTKPPPVRDWDWQSFAILPNFIRGRSHWTTRLRAVCARASGYPRECLAYGFAQPEAIRFAKRIYNLAEIHLSALTLNRRKAVVFCAPDNTAGRS